MRTERGVALDGLHSFPILTAWQRYGALSVSCFFALPPVREIDLIGAIDVFGATNQIAGGKPLYNLKVIGAEPVKGGRLARMFGVHLSCDGDYMPLPLCLLTFGRRSGKFASRLRNC